MSRLMIFSDTITWLMHWPLELENLDERLTNIRKIVQNLPRANFDLLKLISEHLDKCVNFISPPIHTEHSTE